MNNQKASPANQLYLPFDSLSLGEARGKLYQNKDWLYQKYESQIFIKCEFCNILFNPISPYLFTQDGKEYITERWRRTCSDKCMTNLMTKTRIAKKHKLICEFCNKTFYSYRHNTEFCSNSCRNRYRTKDNYDKCKKCGKEYKRHAAKKFCSAECRETQHSRTCFICKKIVRHHGQKYCSKKCATKAQTKKVKKQCRVCDKEFETTPSYSDKGKYNCCSYRCSRIDIKRRGIMRGKNNPNWRPDTWKIYICEYCGKKYQKLAIEESRTHYCSLECRNRGNVGERASNWRGGVSFEPYSKEFNGILRRYIRKRDEYTCQLCNIKENGQAHDCHHIDYNKENNCLSNFILLCRSCHMPTNGNRFFWESNFKSRKLLPA